MSKSRRHLDFLPELRLKELAAAVLHIPDASNHRQPIRILEIGAGTGEQARALSSAGYDVTAIDIASGTYSKQRVFPVVEYDGHTLPFDDLSFDVIYTSHVLEHIQDLGGILREIRRVLRPNGLAVHLVPSASSRLWTMLAHYVWAGGRIIDAVGLMFTRRRLDSYPAPRMPRNSGDWKKTIVPGRHGERGNWINEFLYYRRIWWVMEFKKAGFLVFSITGSGVFSTMSNALAGRLSINVRANLSKILGPSAWVYAMRLQKEPRSP